MSGSRESFDTENLTLYDRAVLFPGRAVWLRWSAGELRSAVGGEGLQAFFVFALAAILVSMGVIVTGRTWNEGDRDFDVLPFTLVPKSLAWTFLVVLVMIGVWLVVRSIAYRWWPLAIALLLLAVAAVLVKQWETISGWNGVITLPAFWLAYVLSSALCGWLLSAQVTKPWLRVFVAVTLVLATLLLITIGRNARVEEAREDLRASARPLLESWTADDMELARQTLGRQGTASGGATQGDGVAGDDRGEIAGAERSVLVEAALLDSMCKEARKDGPLGTRETSVDEQCNAIAERLRPDDTELLKLDDVELRRRLEMRCLAGWSIAAVDIWLEEASADRRVAALSALTSCEAGSANPAAEQEVELSDTDGDGALQPTAEAKTSTENEQSAEGSTQDESTDETEPPPTPPSEEAQAAVNEAFAVQRSEVRMFESIAGGSDEILRVASGPTDFAEFRFSGAAWLVLLAGALFWYRQVEIRAGARRLGPVDVLFDKSARPDDDSEADGESDEGARETRTATNVAEAVFKESVIRNVPEPGAIPGSEALAPVGDLVSQSDVPHKTLVSGAIEVLQTVFATRGGFSVVFSCRRSEEAGTDQAEVVFVRLKSRRTGGQVASKVFRGANVERAAQEAGYWTAGWIIARSDYVPAWAKWSEEDADVFINLQWSGGPGTRQSSARAADPWDLDGPAVNSVALAQRAYQRQITPPPRRDPSSAGSTETGDEQRRRNHLAALEDFARAVHRQPRYPVARYRRGAVLSTMMHLGGNVWEAAGLEKMPAASDVRILGKARLYYLFHDLIANDSRTAFDCDRRRIAADMDVLLVTGAFPPEFRTMMLRIAAEWSNRNRLAIRWGWAAALRPSERFFWKDFNEGDLGGDWVKLLRSDLCLGAERLIQDATDRGDRQLERPAPAEPHRVEIRFWNRKLHEFKMWREERRFKRLSQQLNRKQQSQMKDRLAKLVKEVEHRAMEPDSHWQISYNLACLHAIRAQRIRASEAPVAAEAPGAPRAQEDDASTPPTRLEGKPTNTNEVGPETRQSDRPKTSGETEAGTTGNDQPEATQRTEPGAPAASGGPTTEPGGSATTKSAEPGTADYEQLEALKWLERCLDRPASDQLVLEWVDAEGDLNSLRAVDGFKAWRKRVQSVRQAERERRRERSGYL